MGENVVDISMLRETNYYLLECLERFSGIEITCYGDDRFFDVQNHPNFNPIRYNEPYRSQILELCDKQDIPVIFVDKFHVSFVAVRVETLNGIPAYFLVGPMALQAMDRVTLHRYYLFHGMKHAEEKQIPVISRSKLVMMAQMVAGLVLKRQFTEKELLHVNKLRNLSVKDDKIHITMEKEEQDSYHHTYEDERKLLNCVKNGQTEEALRLNFSMDDAIGLMSKNSSSQVEKTAIVAITLTTRAAIEGGLTPYEAYQISDYYLQKLDQCNSDRELLQCKNQAVRTLTDRVYKHKTEQKASGYVESCINYINRHYREHIYLDDLAETIGISPTYLSRLFSKEMGTSFQEYVVKVRVERAANLLTYSDATIAEIGDYVNFPSQSYFGRVFKKYMGSTPRLYREQNKPREFGENQL